VSVHQTERYKQIKGILGIPEDEPIFILRGQDKLAAGAIESYEDDADRKDGREEGFSPTQEWFAQIDGHANEFRLFASGNPERMKFPD
jgi:hypothetical protein